MIMSIEEASNCHFGENIKPKIANMSPGYQGDVRFLQWDKWMSCYEVFLIKINDSWVVVHAYKWSKSSEF